MHQHLQCPCVEAAASSPCVYSASDYVFASIHMAQAYYEALLRLPDSAIQTIRSFLVTRCTLCDASKFPVLVKDGQGTVQFWCIRCYIGLLEDWSPQKCIDLSDDSARLGSGVRDPEEV